MRLTVADLEAPDDQPTSSHAEPVAGFETTSHILYIPLAAGTPATATDDAIANLPPWALSNHMTVVAVQPWRREEVDEFALDDMSERVRGGPLYTLEHSDTDGTPVLIHQRGPKIFGLDDEGLIPLLRQADLMALLKRPGSHLPATGFLHYEGPNGRHYGAFLRPGFALRTSEALDRVAFWTLPEMRGRTHIVVDHWSMRAAGQHCAAYAQRFFDEVEAPVYVESLRTYDEPRASLEDRLRRTFPRPTTDEALFLLSINSTGAMAYGLVLPAMEAASQVGATVIALAQSSPAPAKSVQALASLDETFSRHSPTACPLCTTQRIVLPIERDTYLMKLAAYTSETAITINDTKHSTPVMEMYAQKTSEAPAGEEIDDVGSHESAFSLHKTHRDGRHHAFFVDVLPMLGRESFPANLKLAVAKITDVHPQVILHPPERAARELAAQVSELMRVDRVISTHDYGLRRLSAADQELLCTATDVLIVDDVVISGRRIDGYRQALIKLRREADHDSEVNLGCLVGVARARDAKALRGSRDFVHDLPGHRSFAAVETLHLPNWDRRRCPWCRELRMLEQLPDAVRALAPIERRIEQLKREDGLDEIFLNWDPAQPVPVLDTGGIGEDEWKNEGGRTQKVSEEYGGRYWELNPGSVFGGLQQSDLVVSIAAAIQVLRVKVDHDAKPSASRLDERFQSPISKVLDPELYLLGRFYEPVLTASILRACQAWDIRSPDGDEELGDALDQILTGLESGSGLIPEFIVLAALGHLPKTSMQKVAIDNPDLAAFREALIGSSPAAE